MSSLQTERPRGRVRTRSSVAPAATRRRRVDTSLAAESEEPLPIAGSKFVGSDVVAGPAGFQPLAGDAIASKEAFLWHLGREKRRTDRSGVPLSLLIFRVDGLNGTHFSGRVRELLEVLCESKRETDLVGHLGKNRAGVLLLVTDRAGAERFAEKIGPRTTSLSSSCSIQTYPDTPLHPEALDQDVEDLSDSILTIAGGHGDPVMRLPPRVGSRALSVLLSPVRLITELISLFRRPLSPPR